MLRRLFEPKIQNLIQKHSQLGYPTTFTELDSWVRPKNIATNVADQYSAIFSHLKELEESATVDTTSLPFLDSGFQLTQSTTFSLDQLRRLECYLVNFDPVLQDILDIPNDSAVVYSVNWDENAESGQFTDYMSGARQGVLLLCAQALLITKKSDFEAVPKLIQSAIHLTSSLKSIPLMITNLAVSSCINQLIECIEWCVNHTKGAEQVAAEVLPHLVVLDDESWLARSFAGEFCFARESWGQEPTVERLLDIWMVRKIPWAPIIQFYISIGWRWADWHKSLYLRHREVVASCESFPGRLTHWHKIERECERAGFLYPSVRRGFYGGKFAINDALVISSLRAACAGLTYIQSSSQELPDEICRKHNDPFMGEPLLNSTKDSAVVFYCVGPNKRDDGGTKNVNPESKSWSGDVTFTVPAKD